MSIIDKIFGDPNEKVVKTLRPVVEQVNNLEDKFKAMSDQELRAQTVEFRKRLKVETDGENESRSYRSADASLQDDMEKILQELLPETFAVVREAAKRVLGQRHYDAQLMGGIVLHRGQIAEMRTGEGKTLVATLPAYLNALTGRGVHVITVNDYLAKRDAEWMGQVYNFLGLSVGCITHEQAFKFSSDNNEKTPLSPLLKGGVLVQAPRKEAYACDILYGTNNEYGFDYLRDNMAPDLNSMVQRGLSYAIVDEVDSILIDEARTPLIISAPAEESTDKYYKFGQLVEQLIEDEDYNIDEKMRAVSLTEAGIAKIEKFLGVENIYADGGMSDVHHLEQALKAKYLFNWDKPKKQYIVKDYVVKDGEVIIVDEFTGRLMHGRRYSEGLHQAIEAKEKVEIQRESQTMATVTFQNYFRMYAKLAGMTGTAVTEAEEFSKIYNLETVVIPTNRPMIRKDLNDLIYASEIGKFKAVVEEIKRRHATGQPVLVGTISIEKNEVLGEMLEREGVIPQILNAKHHEKEAQIIARAGEFGGVTIATNMAGRGVDIILGGSSAGSASSQQAGSEQTEEGRNKVLGMGGLHIIGTERHESRRIDNQLRGRAGRQGDPGSSQFYVSMEDDLMRIFGGDRMKSLMATLKVPEDLPIENGMVSRSIESAQRKVEGNNFDIRKHLVEYDDVINKHRETIYRKRREILELGETPPLNLPLIKGENSLVPLLNKEGAGGGFAGDSKTLSSIILEMIENEIEQAVIFHTAADSSRDWNVQEIYQVTSTIFNVEPKLKEELASFIKDGDKLDKVKVRTKICDHLIALAKANYAKITKLAAEAGVNWLQVEKSVLIRSMDMLWIEHLEAMDHMRHGIGLRGYGQRDPLIEYKKEAYILYNELNNLIQKQVAYSIFKVADLGNFVAPTLKTRPQNYIAPAKTMEKNTGSFSAFKSGGDDNPSAGSPRPDFVVSAQSNELGTKAGQGKKNATIGLVHEKVKDAEGQKVGRNDPCPCGSGKKFKKCCGK